MATPGLSLLGFLDEPSAATLLRNACVVPDATPEALSAIWREAQAKLGTAIPRAGLPTMEDIPPEGAEHMASLLQQQWVQVALGSDIAGGTFKMVELEPLLAYQLNVDIARSDHHNGSADAPSTTQLFNMCLPLEKVIENITTVTHANAMLVTSRGLNFRPFAQGAFPTPVGTLIGMHVGVSLPLMHVVRYNGRAYLHNGFHRAVGLGRRGVKMAPCVVRDVTDPGAVGIVPPLTIGLPVLESDNPPTVGHFINDRAIGVQLKILSRTLHISWFDHITAVD